MIGMKLKYVCILCLWKYGPSIEGQGKFPSVFQTSIPNRRGPTPNQPREAKTYAGNTERLEISFLLVRAVEASPAVLGSKCRARPSPLVPSIGPLTPTAEPPTLNPFFRRFIVAAEGAEQTGRWNLSNQDREPSLGQGWPCCPAQSEASETRWDQKDGINPIQQPLCIISV
jgi:hypothetical protein